MAFDACPAHLWLEDLADQPRITQMRIFGVLCLAQFGQML